MHRGTEATSNTTQDFLTYGAIGLELDRACERRERDWGASQPSGRSQGAARRLIGAWLIALGRNVARAPKPAAAAR